MKIKKSCSHGCTRDDLSHLKIDFDHFDIWMRGKTYSQCNGKIFNHETKKYEESSCLKNPHGDIYYEWDVEQYMRIFQHE